LSGLTPVLILWSDLPEVLKALPAALAAIAAGVVGVFQWRESYPRFAFVCEALKSERLKFETRTTAEYSPDSGRAPGAEPLCVSHGGTRHGRGHRLASANAKGSRPA